MFSLLWLLSFFKVPRTVHSLLQVCEKALKASIFFDLKQPMEHKVLKSHHTLSLLLECGKASFLLISSFSAFFFFWM